MRGIIGRVFSFCGVGDPICPKPRIKQVNGQIEGLYTPEAWREQGEKSNKTVYTPEAEEKVGESLI